MKKLEFEVAPAIAFYCENLIEQIARYMSFTPHRLESFKLVCPLYLGSFKCLEPLMVFLQFNEDSDTLNEIVIDLDIGIAVDATEEFF